MWFSNSHFQPQGKTAVIIGASQGIGADFAQRLYEQNCSVILVARTESKLKEQVARIKAAAATSAASDTNTTLIDHVVCDATDYEACAAMWNTLLSEKRYDPDFIFCCAGLSIPKLFSDLSGSELAAGININYMTAVNAIHAGHRAVLHAHGSISPAQFKPRHIVLFLSTVSSFPFIGYAQYAPSKAAIVSLSTILRQELFHYNYRVTCVHPGNFLSEGYAEEQKTKPAVTKTIEGPSKAIPSLECCDYVLSQLAKGYDSIYTDLIGWVLASTVLGINPRCWGLFQIIVSFVFSIIEPIVLYFVRSDIRAFYKSESNDKKLN